MIKAEDLRIGDLVKVRKGYVFTEDEICKVVATESCSLGKNNGRRLYNVERTKLG